ncbi:MAG: sigma-70 family RNA polymerase sigma factor [Verrucomicrobia bacterium]|nr:sigma-70 family RNA polymerase sigma factor [Verrucomicrobiota bacterium]
MKNEIDELIPTRSSLLSRLKDWDDQESWRDFFNTYWKLIYGVAIKAGLSDTEAQDVVQETVLVVAKKMQDFKYDPAIGSFKGWLLHTTRWRIEDQRRKRLPEPTLPAYAPEDTARTPTVERVPDPHGFDLDAVWDGEWTKNLIDRALDRVKRQVKPKQYQLFHLYVIKQWPVEEIVKTFGVSADQVYAAKSRISPLVQKEIEYLETRMI